MKIVRASTRVMGTPWRNLLFLKLETDEGIVGWSEARPLNRIDTVLGYLNETFERHVAGADPFELERLIRRLSRDDYGRPGEVVMTGLALFEIACWDIVGKALGQPVYRLLGGAVRERIRAYANGWYRTERTPEAFHAAAAAVVARGYDALKFDPFGAGYFHLDHAERLEVAALVEAVRDAIGPDTDILLEMHGRFDPATAVAMIRELAPYRLFWAEEPIPPENMAALRDVREAALPLGVPIATGERLHTPHEVRELFERRSADILQIDITHFGGLWNAKKVAGTAETHYLQMAPHNVGGPLSTAAALHLAAATPNFLIQEYFNDFADPYVRDAARGLPAVEDGSFALPEGPGLGLEIDEEVLAAHPRRETHFNLYQEGWQRRDGEE